MKTNDEITINRKMKCPLDAKLKGLNKQFKKIHLNNLIKESCCHIHSKKWHMIHHIFFCRLFCKNYKFMINKYNNYSKSAQISL